MPVGINLPEIGIYYTPPAQQAPNIGAEFLSAWSAERSMRNRQLFAAALAAADPETRYRTLDALAAQRTQTADSIASSLRTAMKAKSDTALAVADALKSVAGIEQARIAGQAGIETAEIGREGKLIEARRVSSPQARELLAGFNGELAAATRDINAARDAQDEEAAVKAYALLDAATQRARDAALRLPDGLERDALKEAMQTAVSAQAVPPADRALLQETVASYLQPTSLPPAELRDRGVSARGFDDLMREILPYLPEATPAANPAGGASSLDGGSLRPVGSAAGGAGAPPAGAGPERRALLPVDTSSSTSVGGSGGVVAPELYDNLRVLDELIAGVQAGDPVEALRARYGRQPRQPKAKARAAAKPLAEQVLPEPEVSELEASVRDAKVGTGGPTEFVQRLPFEPPPAKPAAKRPARIAPPEPGESENLSIADQIDRLLPPQSESDEDEEEVKRKRVPSLLRSSSR